MHSKLASQLVSRDALAATYPGPWRGASGGRRWPGGVKRLAVPPTGGMAEGVGGVPAPWLRASLFSCPNEGEPREVTGSMWYVVQVTGGTEERMAELIQSVAAPGVLEECFLPRYQTEIKVRGEFRPVEKPLLTGYLFAVTDDPGRLARDLARLPEFACVLKVGGAYAPLSREEEAWLGAFTEPGRRCVPMSYGVVAGEKIVVTEGPLKGHEAMIAEVDRRRSVAYLRFEICGREVTTRVGLGLVARLPETARAEAERVVSERRARARARRCSMEGICG